MRKRMEAVEDCMVTLLGIERLTPGREELIRRIELFAGLVDFKPTTEHVHFLLNRVMERIKRNYRCLTCGQYRAWSENVPEVIGTCGSCGKWAIHIKL